MSKHTPGHFSARYDGAITVRDKDDNQLAICTHMLTKTGGRRDTNEVEKNAKLFAAAPELLEALQFVMTASGEQLGTAFEQAQAAIAKATGEQT